MVKYLNKEKLHGFSLFELIVVMGILMMLTLIVFPTTVNKAQESKLESYVYQLVTDIYYQQQRSNFKNIPTGISLSSNGYTLFDGISLLDATDTDTKSYPSNISITSVSLLTGNEILFDKGLFKPISYGFFTLSDGLNSIRVEINREGLIEYEIL